jgi:acyl-CoA thioesterase FadM
VHVEADYHRPALMGDWLRLRTHITHVGKSSIRWETVIFNERTNEAGAVLRYVVACIDRRTLKSRPLPPEIRGALQECLGETTP